MAPVIYILAAFTMLVSSYLLLRSYAQVKKRLLLWSGLCFLGLAVSNFLIFVDLVIFPQIDLYPLRLGLTTVSIALLVFGMIWEGEA